MGGVEVWGSEGGGEWEREELVRASARSRWREKASDKEH